MAPPDAAAGDQFGYSLAMSGNVCVVGARLDDAGAVNCGSASVFRYNFMQGAWVFEAKLTAADPGTGDEFGYSVAVFAAAPTSAPPGADTIVVGARHDDDHGADSGSAYVFEKPPGGAWIQAAKLSPADGAASDRFGFAVGIANNLILVGARDDDAPATNSGSVYAYRHNGSAWAQHAKLTVSDAAANDQFGHALSMAPTSLPGGAVALIGAWHDDAPASDSGSAYIFRYSPVTSAWSQGAKITASDAAATDEFGYSVAIRATPTVELAVIGARNNDDDGSNSGAAYIFRHVGTEWLQEAKLVGADSAAGDQLGTSVAMTQMGQTAIAGAWHHDQGGPDAGAAYVFQRGPAKTWTQIAKLTAPVPEANQALGMSVAAGMDRAVLGAHQSDVGGVDSGLALGFAGVSLADTNENATPDGCDIPGDLDGSGKVTVSDLIAILQAWGPCPPPPDSCPADLNFDGLVNVHDLWVAIANW